jgi:hypothetical protein
MRRLPRHHRLSMRWIGGIPTGAFTKESKLQDILADPPADAAKIKKFLDAVQKASPALILISFSMSAGMRETSRC